MSDTWHYEDSPSTGVKVKKSQPTKQPICLLCKHFGGILANGKAYCKAFPDGIPDKFWDAKIDHTAPYPGDNNITFEP